MYYAVVHACGAIGVRPVFGAGQGFRPLAMQLAQLLSSRQQLVPCTARTASKRLATFLDALNILVASGPSMHAPVPPGFFPSRLDCAAAGYIVCLPIYTTLIPHSCPLVGLDWRRARSLLRCGCHHLRSEAGCRHARGHICVRAAHHIHRAGPYR